MELSPTNPLLLLVSFWGLLFVCVDFFFLLLLAEQTEICVFIVSILFSHSEFIWKQKPHLCPIIKINLSNNMLSPYPLRQDWSCVHCSLRISTILPSQRYSTLSSMNWKVHVQHICKETSATNSPHLSAPISFRARRKEQKGLHGPENHVKKKKKKNSPWNKFHAILNFTDNSQDFIFSFKLMVNTENVSITHCP